MMFPAHHMPAVGTLYGLSVASELDLTLPASGGEVDVVVSRGEVAIGGDLIWQTESPISAGCFRDGNITILTVPGVRFAVGRDRVVVDAEDEVAAAHLLSHVVWSLVLDARGQSTLHGSAVARDGRAIAVIGESGSGKSTAVLALLDRGWQLVSDDLLTFDADGRVVPGPSYIRLLPDRAVGRAGRIDAGGKLRYDVRGTTDPVPLAAIVVHGAGFSSWTPLTGMRAVSVLLAHAYEPLPARAEQAHRRFNLAIGLSTRIPVYGVPPRSLTADQLEKLLEGDV